MHEAVGAAGGGGQRADTLAGGVPLHEILSERLTLGSDDHVTVVPTEAVQTGQKGQYAFVVKSDQTVESRVLTVGRTVGHETVILQGIQTGETVVTDGQLRLIPGFKVKIETATPNPGAAKGSGASQ